MPLRGFRHRIRLSLRGVSPRFQPSFRPLSTFVRSPLAALRCWHGLLTSGNRAATAMGECCPSCCPNLSVWTALKSLSRKAHRRVLSSGPNTDTQRHLRRSPNRSPSSQVWRAVWRAVSPAGIRTYGSARQLAKLFAHTRAPLAPPAACGANRVQTLRVYPKWPAPGEASRGGRVTVQRMAAGFLSRRSKTARASRVRRASGAPFANCLSKSRASGAAICSSVWKARARRSASGSSSSPFAFSRRCSMRRRTSADGCSFRRGGAAPRPLPAIGPDRLPLSHARRSHRYRDRPAVGGSDLRPSATPAAVCRESARRLGTGGRPVATRPAGRASHPVPPDRSRVVRFGLASALRPAPVGRRAVRAGSRPTRYRQRRLSPTAAHRRRKPRNKHRLAAPRTQDSLAAMDLPQPQDAVTLALGVCPSRQQPAVRGEGQRHAPNSGRDPPRGVPGPLSRPTAEASHPWPRWFCRPGKKRPRRCCTFSIGEFPFRWQPPTSQENRSSCLRRRGVCRLGRRRVR